MHWFANPLRFQRLADAVFPYVLTAAVALTAVGLWGGLVMAPPDYQMGDAFRIIYVHVPAAWLALFGYLTLAIAAVFSIVWRHPLADVYGRAAAPVGAVFCLLALVTGSIWGKPMWGTWWVWDARLTSMLILLFLYLGYMALANAFDDRQRGAKAAAVLALVGAINIPIIKFSVDWWNTLHQPASVNPMGQSGIAIDGSMLIPLFAMAIAFKAYYVTTMLLGMRRDIAAAKVRAMRMAAVHG